MSDRPIEIPPAPPPERPIPPPSGPETPPVPIELPPMPLPGYAPDAPPPPQVV
jgi:hypothetical protein